MNDDSVRDVVNKVKDAFVHEQVEKLANFIMQSVDGEPSQDQGACETAIRIIKSLQVRVDILKNPLVTYSLVTRETDDNYARIPITGGAFQEDIDSRPTWVATYSNGTCLELSLNDTSNTSL